MFITRYTSPTNSYGAYYKTWHVFGYRFLKVAVTERFISFFFLGFIIAWSRKLGRIAFFCRDDS